MPLGGYHRPGELRVFRRPGVITMAYPNRDHGIDLRLSHRQRDDLEAFLGAL